MLLDPTELRRRCQEAQAWCTSALARPGYWTPALRVELLDSPWIGQLRVLCEDVVERRRRLLADIPVTETRGAVVVCDILETVSCGASEAASKGFFDGDDRPAWDTWLGVVQDDGGQPLLLAWVPPRDVECVNLAIAVNPVGCNYWHEGGTVPRPSVLHQFRTVDLDDEWEDEAVWTPREPPELFASPRMPQVSFWLPLALGAVFTVVNLTFQTFLSSYGAWAAFAGLVALAVVFALARRSN